MNPGETKIISSPPASILVVDDTPANLQVLTGMLKERDYKIRPVPSGKLALQAASHDPPDLILLDINMPDMNGYEVCEKLKADDKLKGIPIIFISATRDEAVRARVVELGALACLPKPFSDTALLEALRLVLPPNGKARELSRPS